MWASVTLLAGWGEMEDKIVWVRARLREKIDDVEKDLQFYRFLLEVIDFAFPSQASLQASVEGVGAFPVRASVSVAGSGGMYPQPASRFTSEKMEVTVSDKSVRVKFARSIEPEMLSADKRRYLSLFFGKVRELNLMADVKPSGKLIEEIVVVNCFDGKDVDEVARLINVVLAKVLS